MKQQHEIYIRIWPSPTTPVPLARTLQPLTVANCDTVAIDVRVDGTMQLTSDAKLTLAVEIPTWHAAVLFGAGLVTGLIITLPALLK